MFSSAGAQPISEKLLKGLGCSPTGKRTGGYRRALLAEAESPVWVPTGFACYPTFPMVASAISQMEIGGNRRLGYPKAKRTGTVNGGASRSS